MHAYGYTEETERFPIDYEVFFLPYSLLFTSNHEVSVAGESCHLVLQCQYS